jgi:hypothetical protein
LTRKVIHSRPQWMVRWNTLLGRDVTEYSFLQVVVAVDFEKANREILRPEDREVTSDQRSDSLL